MEKACTIEIERAMGKNPAYNYSNGGNIPCVETDGELSRV